MLDLLLHLAEYSGSSPFLLLDVDCLFLASSAPLFQAIEADGVISYVIEELAADTTYDNNGLTLQQLQVVGNEIAGSPIQPIQPCGGEIIGARSPVANEVASTAHWAIGKGHERFSQKRPRFLTEEHVLSFTLAYLGLPAGNANGMIRRLWTQRSYRNVHQSDLDLLIWHLPAEKSYGFARLFREVTNPGSRFWGLPIGAEYSQYLGSHVGVPSTNLRKRLSDGWTAFLRRTWNTR